MFTFLANDLMHIQIITLIPEIFQAINFGVLGRAQKTGKINIQMLPLREFSPHPLKGIDDRPYGGGPGMIIAAPPLKAAIDTALKKVPQDTKVAALSPHGKKFTQTIAKQLSQRTHLIFVVGRYTGIDERIIQNNIDEQWSIGDFILSGGEFACLCIIDAICRCIPDVLGHEDSAKFDSFSQDKPLLSHPHYTRPLSFNQLSVPKVLNSGNHKAIARWRLQQSLGLTWKKRPDLLEGYVLNEQEQLLLAEFISQDKAKDS